MALDRSEKSTGHRMCRKPGIALLQSKDDYIRYILAGASAWAGVKPDTKRSRQHNDLAECPKDRCLEFAPYDEVLAWAGWNAPSPARRLTTFRVTPTTCSGAWQARRIRRAGRYRTGMMPPAGSKR